MQMGLVGLGRTGAGMARRLAQSGVRVVCTDRSETARGALAGVPNVACVESLAALCAQLDGRRVIVLMLPAGGVEETLAELLPLVSADDTIVDGGNSYYRDSMQRALALSRQGLRYVDAGVSGANNGAQHGYCLMLGGTPKSIETFEPFARILAAHPEHGWLHCGPSGAGHFARMVHDGVECAMKQSLAEGFALLAARKDLDIDVPRLAEIWRRAGASGDAGDSGEGRWTALESVELGVPAPVITLAVMSRLARG